LAINIVSNAIAKNSPMRTNIALTICIAFLERVGPPIKSLGFNNRCEGNGLRAALPPGGQRETTTPANGFLRAGANLDIAYSL
jgi:hypothetical protein